MPSAGRIAAVVLVFAAIGAAVAVDLGRPFGNGDEVIYAQAVRELQEGGDLSAMHYLGYPVLERPVLPFAIAAVGAFALDGEIGLRLTSALFGLGALAALAWIARRETGRLDAALFAVVLCAAAPSFRLFATSLLSDPPFVLCVVIAAGGALRAQRDGRGLVVAGLGLGGALAMKSLAAAPVALALAPWLVVGLRRHGWRPALIGVGALVVLAAPFYVLGVVNYGARFVDDHLVRSLAARAAGGFRIGMPGGEAAYLGYLASIDGWPTLIWVIGAPLAAVGLGMRRRRRGLVASGAIALGAFAALSLIGTRLPHYLLPVYPLAALAVAALYAELAPAVARLGFDRRLGVGVLFAAAFTLFVAGLADRAPEAHFLPSDEARPIGLAAAGEPPDRPLTLLEWYAPAAAFYAERRYHIATASPDLFDAVDNVRYLHRTGVPQRLPPAAPGTELLVAGPRAAIAAAGWLRVDAIVKEVGEVALVRGVVRP